MKTKMKTNHPNLLCGIIAFAALLVCPNLNAAAAKTQADGDWNTGDTWEDNAVPTPGSDTNINIVSGDDIFLKTGDDAAITYLRIASTGGVSGGTSSLTIGGGTDPIKLTLNCTSAMDNNVTDIGRTTGGVTGILNLLDNGTFDASVGNVRLGFSTGSMGIVNVTGGTFLAKALDIGSASKAGGGNGSAGNGGSGNFTINSGVATIGGIVNVGNNSVAGTADLNVKGGVFTSTSDIVVANGTNGRGNVTVTDGELSASRFFLGNNGGTANLTVSGGEISVNTGLHVGYGADSTATATISKGEVDVGLLYVGSNGTGTLKFNGGNITVGTNTSTTMLQIGSSAGSSGTFIVDGGKLVSNANTGILVGNAGEGRFELKSGEVTINGAGTLELGRSAIGDVVISGGKLNTFGNFLIGNSTNVANRGTYTQSGGDVTAGNVIIGNRTGGGILNLSGGNLIVAADFTVGTAAGGANSFLTLSGGNLSIGGNLTVNENATLTFVTGANRNFKGISAQNLAFDGSSSPKLIVDLAAFTETFTGTIDIVLITLTDIGGSPEPTFTFDTDVLNAASNIIDWDFSWQSPLGDNSWHYVLTLQAAIPEPSTYAAILGLLALLALRLRRRK